MTHSLGPFDFRVFHRPNDRGGPPLLIAERAEVLQRGGIDGTGILRKGLKGEPFDMRSGTDFVDFEAADAEADSYLSIVNADTYTLVWNSVNYETEHGVKYVVLGVEPQKVRKIAASVGGLVANSAAWLEATWNLIAVDAGS